MDALLEQLNGQEALISAIIVLSVILLLATLFATPWLLARLPADYFSREQPLKYAERSVRSAFVFVLRNVAGVLIFLFGVLLIVTPGPGLVFMVIGLIICDFPKKHRLMQAFVSKPSVLSALNWARKKSGRDNFIAPNYS